MSEIKGSVFWITGASSGIGEATALAAAQKGARLVLSARREEELERVKNLPAWPVKMCWSYPSTWKTRRRFSLP